MKRRWGDFLIYGEGGFSLFFRPKVSARAGGNSSNRNRFFMNSSKLILLVDDERHIRAFMRTILKRGGYEEPLEASNGKEAVTLFEEHRPDLVLLDLNMPHMDGITCLNEMRERDISAKILVLTAMANEKAVQECREGGADGFLRKDAPPEEMMRAVEEALSGLKNP